MAKLIKIKKKSIRQIFLLVVIFLLLILFLSWIDTDKEVELNYDNQISKDILNEKILENIPLEIKEIHFDHMPIKYFLSIDTRNKADDKYEENVIKTCFRDNRKFYRKSCSV